MFTLFKVLETFDGYVDKIEDGTAYVSFESRHNNDRFNGSYLANKLKKKGIKERDCFIFETILFLGWTNVRFKYKPPNKLSQETIDQIGREIEERLKDWNSETEI